MSASIRWLAIVAAVVAVTVVAGIAVTLAAGGAESYAEGTPERTVQDYLHAISDRDPTKQTRSSPLTSPRDVRRPTGSRSPFAAELR